MTEVKAKIGKVEAKIEAMETANPNNPRLAGLQQELAGLQQELAELRKEKNLLLQHAMQGTSMPG